MYHDWEHKANSKKGCTTSFHNVVKGGWKVALHNKQKNIVGLMHKVGHLQNMVGNNGN